MNEISCNDFDIAESQMQAIISYPVQSILVEVRAVPPLKSNICEQLRKELNRRGIDLRVE